MKLRVDTFQTANPDEVEFSRDIDYKFKSDREWLNKHICWAIHNGRGVEVTPLEQGAEE